MYLFSFLVCREPSLDCPLHLLERHFWTSLIDCPGLLLDCIVSLLDGPRRLSDGLESLLVRLGPP